MSQLTCSEVDEMLAAHAMDSLTAAEAEQIEEHLRSCERHTQALTELRQAALLIGLTADDLEPSAQLRSRILQAIQEPLEPGVVPMRRAPRKPAWAPRPALAAIAAAVLLSLGTGIAGYLVGQGSSNQKAYVFQGGSQAPRAVARLIYFKDAGNALVAVTGLPALPAGKVYEMWLIRGGTPVPEGIAEAPGGDLIARISSDVRDFNQFAITVEPGLMAQPTTAPILIGQL